MSTREEENSARRLPTKTDAYHLSSDSSFFSVSFPALLHEKLNFRESDQNSQLLDVGFPSLGKLCIEDGIAYPLEDTDLNAIGSFLLDNEDDFDLSGLPTQLEDLDDDVFGSGGGLEIEKESQESLVNNISGVNATGSINGSSISYYGFVNGGGTVSGEHPHGEHPSRTLFVRNINSSVDDSELRSLFEQYGDIRKMYTACKHRGFVMISYYDIRAARAAMHALQNKPLRRRKMDIHYSIPKNNPSGKDVNQGTLVVLNLDPLVSNDVLRQIFGAYGEIKEIRETPNKRHQRFIEFYDARAAEAALKALNRSDIYGKRVKLEPSRPGGLHRSLMLQLSQEQEQDEARTFHKQIRSPIANASLGSWPNNSNLVNQNSLHSSSKVPESGPLNPIGTVHVPGLASILPSHASAPANIAPIGKDPSWISQAITTAETQHGLSLQQHLFIPSSTLSLSHTPVRPFSDFKSMAETQHGVSFQQHFSIPGSTLSLSPRPLSPFSDFTSSSAGTFSGPEFLWGSPTIRSGHVNTLAQTTSLNAHPFPPREQGIGFMYPSWHSSFLGSHHHHIGSAPSGLQLERNFGLFPDLTASSYVNQASFGLANFGHNNITRAVNVGAPGLTSEGAAFAGNFIQNGYRNFPVMPVSRNETIYFGNSSPVSMDDGTIDCFRARRVDGGSQTDIKKQYQLDLEKIVSGEDTRTTLMIKNIPNKYTSKLLLAAIDEAHKGAYDFLYLPIDFKNKCNVGYAFINMVSPSLIITFYKEFNGKKWESFNSEKVASLAYARIQGKDALIAHFQHSSLMHEDKSCRPIVFRTEGQEHLPSANLNILICRPDGSYAEDSLDSPKGDPYGGAKYTPFVGN